jgi:hypothetical protein
MLKRRVKRVGSHFHVCIEFIVILPRRNKSLARIGVAQVFNSSARPTKRRLTGNTFDPMKRKKSGQSENEKLAQKLSSLIAEVEMGSANLSGVRQIAADRGADALVGS